MDKYWGRTKRFMAVAFLAVAVFNVSGSVQIDSNYASDGKAPKVKFNFLKTGCCEESKYDISKQEQSFKSGKWDSN